MTVLKDGTGTGNLAKVGEHNDLHTRSITVSELSYVSEQGNAFQAEGEAVILATASGEQTVLILINDGTESLEIGNIFISVRTESDATKITVVKLYLGSVTATGGTIKNSINLNTGAVNVADVTLLDHNPTIAGTDYMIMESYFQIGQNSLTVPFDGGIVLQTKGSFRVTVKGAAAVTAGLTCDTSFQFWPEIEV